MAEGPGPTIEGGGDRPTYGDHVCNIESTRESREEGVETMAEGPGPTVEGGGTEPPMETMCIVWRVQEKVEKKVWRQWLKGQVPQ